MARTIGADKPSVSKVTESESLASYSVVATEGSNSVSAFGSKSGSANTFWLLAFLGLAFFSADLSIAGAYFFGALEYSAGAVSMGALFLAGTLSGFAAA